MSERSAGWKSCLTVVVAFAIPWLALGAVASAPLHSSTGPSVAALFHSSSSSTNWAGYAATGSTGSVSFVNGSWIVPTIVGKCPTKAQYSSFWVGIDGFSSSTVEQTGTDSDCSHGKAVYYAWYEFYPSPSVKISSLTISAGDTILASVSYSTSTSKFTVSLADHTTGKSFSTTGSVSSAQRTSAEWIAEAPSGSRGILSLADFGTVDFGADYTSLPATCSATISGTTAVLGSQTSLSSINMVQVHSSTTLKASTSAVSTDGTSFTVTWKSAGP